MTGYQSKKAMTRALPSRDEMVDYLADSDFDYIMEGTGAELLDSYLRNGFKGYEAYTDTELKAEYLQRKEMKNV